MPNPHSHHKGYKKHAWQKPYQHINWCMIPKWSNVDGQNSEPATLAFGLVSVVICSCILPHPPRPPIFKVMFDCDLYARRCWVSLNFENWGREGRAQNFVHLPWKKTPLDGNNGQTLLELNSRFGLLLCTCAVTCVINRDHVFWPHNISHGHTSDVVTRWCCVVEEW